MELLILISVKINVDCKSDSQNMEIQCTFKKSTLLHSNALFSQAAFTQLMHDLKDEGNELFRECLYDIAWMHYRNAIFVARILDTRFYHEVDKEFLSSLFSNRAFCCLKKVNYLSRRG